MGIMITTSQIDEVRRQLRSLSSPGFVLAHDEKFNRLVIEHGECTALVMNHEPHKKDTLRSLELPWNDIIARIAAKNKVALAFDLSTLRIIPSTEQARELARIIESIAVCKKTGAPIALLNAYTPQGARALLRILGASSEQARNVSLYTTPT